MNKLRWGKFWWSDWEGDPALALCSLAAQGLWMRLLCIAAQGTPYGHVTVNGASPDLVTLARLVRARPHDVARLIAELERKGVAARDPECGCLVSRRMFRDGKISAARRTAAAASWRTRDGSDSGVTRERLGSNTMRNNRRKAAGKADSDQNLHMQSPNFASTESDAELDAKSSIKDFASRDAEDADERVVRLNGARARQRPPEDPMDAIRRMCTPIVREDPA